MTERYDCGICRHIERCDCLQCDDCFEVAPWYTAMRHRGTLADALRRIELAAPRELTLRQRVVLPTAMTATLRRAKGDANADA